MNESKKREQAKHVEAICEMASDTRLEKESRRSLDDLADVSRSLDELDKLESLHRLGGLWESAGVLQNNPKYVSKGRRMKRAAITQAARMARRLKRRRQAEKFRQRVVAILCFLRHKFFSKSPK